LPDIFMDENPLLINIYYSVSINNKFIYKKLARGFIRCRQ
jgi:hypothetical protein